MGQYFETFGSNKFGDAGTKGIEVVSGRGAEMGAGTGGQEPLEQVMRMSTRSWCA